MDLHSRGAACRHLAEIVCLTALLPVVIRCPALEKQWRSSIPQPWMMPHQYLTNLPVSTLANLLPHAPSRPHTSSTYVDG